MNTKCPLCGKRITAEDAVRFRVSDAKLIHSYPCGEIRAFVYGTLRAGDVRETWMRGQWYRESASVRGYALHYGRSHRAFPYLVHTGNDDDVVVGELVTIPVEDVNGTRQWKQTVDMETSAGYVLRDVRVDTIKETLDAQAFVWEDKHGDRIESGDWFDRPDADVDVSPGWETDDDDRPVGYMTTGGKPFIVVHDGSGRTLWSGSSFKALGEWRRDNNVRLERTAS